MSALDPLRTLSGGDGLLLLGADGEAHASPLGRRSGAAIVYTGLGAYDALGARYTSAAPFRSGGFLLFADFVSL